MSTIMEMPAINGPMLTPDSVCGVSMRAMNDGEWAVPTSQTPDWHPAGAAPGETGAATESDAGIHVAFRDVSGWLIDMTCPMNGSDHRMRHARSPKCVKFL